MTRPEAMVNGRLVPFRATQLRHPANTDVLRIVAVLFGANDNPIFGGRVS